MVKGLILLLLLLPMIIYADDMSLLHDPTHPPGDEEIGTHFNGGYQVEMIFFTANTRYAMINGNYVKTGDIIDKYRVASIDQYSVSLSGDNMAPLILQVVEDFKHTAAR